MTIPDLEREIDEWWAESQRGLNNAAQRDGYADWQHYQDALAKKEEEKLQARLKEDEEDAARGIHRTGTPTSEERVEMFGEPGRVQRCNCQEHWPADGFCPARLKELLGSRNDSIAAAIDDCHRIRASQLTRELNILAMHRPSGRIPDEEVHQLWALNSQEEQYQLPIPEDLVRDPITQELWARHKNQHASIANGMGLPPSPTLSTVRSSLMSVTSSTASAPQLPTSTAGTSRTQRSGRSTVAPQLDAGMKASHAQRGTGRAPSMKSSNRKKKVEAATPKWLRSLLE
ncbi:MAG: hypothetical protein LQ348_003443 [Seirophora lacunosa]|nr:MAG: hypothetical protein LQ344_003632 [Seirophora lacunosa]KAI4191734.1 MAG: hypothetical protein LQ348_003443 [Seirophora lacunosa]